MTVQFAEKITCLGAVTEFESGVLGTSIHVTIVGFYQERNLGTEKAKHFQVTDV